MKPRSGADSVSGLWFQTYPLPAYPAVFAGLVLLVWFASLANGAHDLWAVTLIGAEISILTIISLYYFYRENRPLYLRFLFPILSLLAAFAISSRYSFDVNTSRLE